ncbi:class C sortase [Pilibacter termitis]|nr:class C sortase [Pilibacter termitis]
MKQSNKKEKEYRRHILMSWLTNLIIVIGLGCLLYPVVTTYFENQKNSYGKLQQMSEIEHMSANALKAMYNDLDRYNEALFDLEDKSLPMTNVKDYDDLLKNFAIMGTLDIASVGIQNLPYVKDADAQALEDKLGHLKGTSLPVGGVNTHAVIVGHSGLKSKELFTNLEKVKVGDTFHLQTVGRSLHYKVIRRVIVEPTDVEKLKIEKGRDLVTLITCTPIMVNSHRLMITGERFVPDTAKTEEVKKRWTLNDGLLALVGTIVSWWFLTWIFIYRRFVGVVLEDSDAMEPRALVRLNRKVKLGEVLVIKRKRKRMTARELVSILNENFEYVEKEKRRRLVTLELKDIESVQLYKGDKIWLAFFKDEKPEKLEPDREQWLTEVQLRRRERERKRRRMNLDDR